MVGTVAERNELIKRVLAGEDKGRLEQMNAQDMEAATALLFLGMQAKVDIQVKPELAKDGGGNEGDAEYV
jgi:hypothetical protein